VRVRVRLFARYREATGQERLDVDVPEGGTVETAWKAIVARHPDLSRYRPYTLFAVGHDYVEPDHRLAPDDELCLFPPVSGGSASRAGASGEASGEMIEHTNDVNAIVDLCLFPPVSSSASRAGASGEASGEMIENTSASRRPFDG